MKISKLFHWLYALLMLLPFAFFVPSVLYYAFNDNATMQSVEVPKTETISVDFNQLRGDFVERSFVEYGVTITTNGEGFVFNGTNNGTGGRLSYYPSLLPTTFNIVDGHKYCVKIDNSSDYNLLCYLNNVQTFEAVYGGYTHDTIFTANSSIIASIGFNFGSLNMSFQDYIIHINVFDLTQMFGVGNEPTLQKFNHMFPNLYYPYTVSELMQITYDTGETEQLVSNTDIINYAWESIWDLPLFSWTKVTFVSVPFAYITGLFGVAASNSLNYVFGYFATISICWLVFDIIMYVPLLVHRWLDKGIVE